MGDKKSIKPAQEMAIEFKVEKGERFSKYTLIEQSKNMQCEQEYDRDVERTVGEFLRIWTIVGWIKPVDREKSKSRGRPATIYECCKDYLMFSVIVGYKCEKCGYIIAMKKESIKFCPNCGDKKVD